MPLVRRCCILNCKSRNLEGISYHCLPANLNLAAKWKEVLTPYADIKRLSQYSTVCSTHFKTEDFNSSTKRRMLRSEAVPSIFSASNDEITTDVIDLLTFPSSTNSHNFCESETQTTITSAQLTNLIYTNRCLKQKLKRMQVSCNKLKQQLNEEKEKNKKYSEWKYMKKIKDDAANFDPRAILILDQIKNYDKKKPVWSEMTIRQCIAWRFCSPKGYEFPRNALLKLPCYTTLKKYFGSGNENLIKNRLLCEIQNLQLSERICSLVVDDMAVRESVRYSKAEDRIFGLETLPNTDISIKNKPVIANQLLCFVIHGLSTKYIIPASYFSDNHKNHVALFKHFGKGTLQNVIAHPFTPGLNFFLSFDNCHVVKNARNLFLDHDMASSDGIISAKYLKELSEIQADFIVKPVRHLTRKHLYPTNLEKMKVSLAIQIFSPSVSGSLKYLAKHGGEEYSHFKDSMATVKYLEFMYKFFQLHDVSNKTQYIHQRDPNTAPYTNIYDSRISWLEQDFTNYITDIQTTSASMGMNGLTKETAEALIFTAKSTSLCVKYLITELNFFYVLTRSFSSDAIESLFSNIRLRNGCNDLTDCKAAEHAIRQILKNGLITAVNSNNTASSVEYTSNAKLTSISTERRQHSSDSCEINVTLNDGLLDKLENLRAFVSPNCSASHIESASTAFLCGYLLMKVEQSVDCILCLSLLRNNFPEKTNPLFELIYNQDRGKLNYPSERFVALIEFVIQIMVEILPSLPKENINSILKPIISSYLINNPIFQCKSHYKIVCSTILDKLIPPIITNFCNLQSERIKKTNIQTKKRKLLKIN